MGGTAPASHRAVRSHSIFALFIFVFSCGEGGPLTPAEDLSTGGGARLGSVKRVLFDAAHKQAVGNAYWVLDSHTPPSPANPTSETAWSGGISAWGYRLVKSGQYTVSQLSSGSLTWGGGGAGDLKNVDVFVSDEPEVEFTAAEQAALMSFVQAGGGIFLASDHSGAKRCTTCSEAWSVINAFLVTGAAADAFGAKCDGNNISATATVSDPRFAAGSFGNGTKLVYHSGSSVSATKTNAFVIAASGTKGMMIGSELTGGGRLILLGDSSPIEDGTCVCSAKLHNGWGDGDDATLILNATAWLAKN